ncbi:phosphatidylglycerol lysyltransferase domain-containing protein [Bacillus marasmi]|uniref:phosphatidylglycerol lysyltransferase domain-containing protein n=1 Tax=Bacillus marasmi TaxID=1926279 RepID=UPI0011CBD897|nr:phosphatidylglycerol lysyltransferase domain-containing protein [Bacillus marasmi]
MEQFVLIFVGLILSTFILLLFLKTKHMIRLEESLDDVQAFIENNGGTHVSHLTFLNDKEVYRTSNNKILFVFQKIGNKFIVLGDPIGKDEFIREGIKEFEQYCKKLNKKPVFYQVSERFMLYYRNFDYRLFKLGEEAKLDLHEFSLAGKKGAKLRTRKNKFERNGFQFGVSFPPHNHELLNRAEEISDCWLGDRKEKGYSVGFFCRDYLSRFPIATLSNPDGEVIAFASLACDKQKRKRTFTIDLMRHISDCPHGTMDFLFLSIFQWCKEKGYDWCSMGMSPLANVGHSKHATIHEKLARFVFEHGDSFYKFKGLHEYKKKFAPQWEARYLVYKKVFLPFLFLQLIILIHQNNAKRDEGKLARGLSRVS